MNWRPAGPSFHGCGVIIEKILGKERRLFSMRVWLASRNRSGNGRRLLIADASGQVPAAMSGEI
jgi:hypothetical protein